MGERCRLSERGMASLLLVERERERERERNGRADGVRTGGLWAAAGAR